MYLCTEGNILAHADVDMSLLLPRDEWQDRSTCEFGRTGLEGDFQLRLPGEPSSETDTQPNQGKGNEEALQRVNRAVVTIGAELCRADADAGAESNPNNLILRGGAGSLVGGGGGAVEHADAAAAAGAGAGASASKVSTWSYLAPTRKRGVVTAALQRLELKPRPSWGTDGAALSDRAGGVLVGITGVGAAGELVPGTTGPGAGGRDSLMPLSQGGDRDRDSFRLVGCGERGEIDTEDSELLETITWRWEGEFPSPASTDAADGGDVLGLGGGEGKGKRGGDRGPLASIKVLTGTDSGSGGGCGDGHGDGDDGVEIATGFVPWPSSACSGRQYANVTLLSPGGSQVGSCRVCLLLSFTATAAATAADGNGAAIGTLTATGVGRTEEGDEDEDTLFEQESDLHATSSAAFEYAEEDKREGTGARGGRGGRGRTKGVQVEEPPLEGIQAAAGGTMPRSYRMSINLASVKDLENAAYVVR